MNASAPRLEERFGISNCFQEPMALFGDLQMVIESPLQVAGESASMVQQSTS